MEQIVNNIKQQELFDKLSDKKSFEKVYVIYLPNFGYYYKNSYRSFTALHNDAYISMGDFTVSENVLLASIFDNITAARDAIYTLTYNKVVYISVYNTQRHEFLEVKNTKWQIQSVALIPYQIEN